MAIGPAVMLIWIVFGGYYCNAENVPRVLRWLPKVRRAWQPPLARAPPSQYQELRPASASIPLWRWPARFLLTKVLQLQAARDVCSPPSPHAATPSPHLLRVAGLPHQAGL